MQKKSVHQCAKSIKKIDNCKKVSISCECGQVSRFFIYARDEAKAVEEGAVNEVNLSYKLSGITYGYLGKAVRSSFQLCAADTYDELQALSETPKRFVASEDVTVTGPCDNKLADQYGPLSLTTVTFSALLSVAPTQRTERSIS